MKRCQDIAALPQSPSSQKLRSRAPRISRGPIDAALGGTHDQSLANVQELSSPQDLPGPYYKAGKSYALLLLGICYYRQDQPSRAIV